MTVASIAFGDRAQETTTSGGTGTLNLAGAQAGYTTLVAALTTHVGGTSPWTDVPYLVTDGTTSWEVGRCTITDSAPDTLTSRTVEASSNGGAAVDWPAGTTKVVALTQTASAMQFCQVYESALQTITAAGSLSLTHDLGGIPRLCWYELDCQTAELNYSVNDRVQVYHHGGGLGTPSANRGCTITPTSTTLEVRYGSDGTAVFEVLNKTTGATAAITDANWKVRFYAAR